MSQTNSVDRKKEQALAESEARFKFLSEATFEGIIIHKNGVIIDANAAAEKITGYTKKDVEGKNVFNFLFTEKELQKVKQNIRKEHAKPYVISVMKKSGEKFWAEIEGRNIFYNGKEVRIVAVRDITEKVEIENALKKSEEKFKTYIQSSPTAVFIADKNGKYTFANPAAGKLLGYSQEEILDMTIPEILPASHLEEGARNFREVKSKGYSQSSELKIITKEGNLKDILIEAVKLSDNEFMAYCRDITKLQNIKRALEEKNKEYEKLTKKLEENLMQQEAVNQELQRAKIKAEESDRLKSVFLGTMSHELRTPLNAIIGFSDVIAENYNDSELTEFADIINRNGIALLNIIENTIELSLIESGQLKLNPEKITLKEYFAKAQTTFELIPGEINRKNVKLNFDGAANHYFSEIFVDQAKLTQVFTNLIKNAFKFTHRGEVNYGYKVNSENEVIFFVKDTGIGIPEDKQSIIFERFRQIDETETREFGGSGLGLTICKEIIDLHNGKIWLEKEKGYSTCFYFCLGSLVIDDLNKPQYEIKKINMLDLNNKNILIAEDEDSNFDLIEILLRRTKANVIRAYDGEDAIKKFQENKNTDLILMDLRMPVMNGFDATKAIRKIDSHIPVIALTALAIQGDKEKALNAGCTDYISKPVKKSKLYEVIGRYL